MLSTHFKRSEFACRCGCGLAFIENELLNVLEDVREHFNKPVYINSGIRCYKHNKKVGGQKHSTHLFGMASDIRVRNVPEKDVADYLESKYPDKYGIGRYWTFTHIDVRPQRARWGSND